MHGRVLILPFYYLYINKCYSCQIGLWLVFFGSSAHAHNSKLNQFNQISWLRSILGALKSIPSSVIFGSTYKVESCKSRPDVGLGAQQCRFRFVCTLCGFGGQSQALAGPVESSASFDINSTASAYH